MKVPFVDLKAQYASIKEEIDEVIHSVLDQTSFLGTPFVDNFERDFAKAYDANHCVAVANGTDALYVALRSIGVQTGDEVITTAHSWISSASTISHAGGKPVFVDVEPRYFTMDPQRIEQSITPRTKALVVVHLYGQMCEMEAIMEIANRHNLFVIEDCAQAHFSTFKGRKAGLFGHLAAFSFYPSKNLGAFGDAGCLLTNQKELADYCRMFGGHGGLEKHEHQIEGICSRMDSLQAAILSVKLKHVAKWNKQRQEKAAFYSQYLESTDLVTPAIREHADHNFHLYVVKSDRRDELRLHLEKKGVGTAIHYPKILPLLPPYRYLNHSADQFPVAYADQQQILSLPMFPELTPEQLNYVVEAIKAF